MRYVDSRDDCEISCIHRDAVEKAKAIEKDPVVIKGLSEIFKVIGDPTRLRIINALSGGEMCVCDLAVSLGMEHSAISHQLRILKSANVVKYRKEGKSAVYSLDDDHVLTLLEIGLKHVGHR